MFNKQSFNIQARNKYIFYRITSRISHKPRMEGFSKLEFLDNLFEAFPDYRVICLADNCDDATVNVLQEKPFYKFVTTALGNAKSFNYFLNQEVPLLSDDDLVYFAEDDYLYTPNASSVFEEGIRFFDYVTLYDHPDKYGTYLGAVNSLVPNGQFSEYTRLLKTSNRLWRTTNSTTMSFGCYAKTIKEDRFIWGFFSKASEIPGDFYIWLMLTCPTRNFVKRKVTIAIVLLASNILSLVKKRRNLGVPIPSASAHMQAGMLPDNFEQDFLSN